jgi:hypothetical protein
MSTGVEQENATGVPVISGNPSKTGKNWVEKSYR